MLHGTCAVFALLAKVLLRLTDDSYDYFLCKYAPDSESMMQNISATFRLIKKTASPTLRESSQTNTIGIGVRPCQKSGLLIACILTYA
jgi:hypothetical protein